ncbi:MAG: O-antigen ligase family protein [Silicimonas sp.]|nr:O-antigen ligase family protein [Silicimonas sp.]
MIADTAQMARALEPATGRGRGAVLIFALGVMLSGVLIFPLDPAGDGRIVPADLFFVTGAVLFLLSSISPSGILTLKLHSRARGVLSVLGLFLLWVALSGVVATFFYRQPLGAFAGTLANYLYGASLTVIIAVACADPRHMRLLLWAYAAAVTIVSVFSVLAMFGTAPDWAYHGGGRIKSTSRSVNQLAAYVAPAIPLFTILCLSRSVRFPTMIVYVTVVGLALLALLGTGSRTALALLLISVLLVVLAAIMLWSSKSAMATAILAASAAGGTGFLLMVLAFWETGMRDLPPQFQALARPLERLLTSSSIETGLGPRYDQITAVWSDWVNHPLFGVGPGNFKSYAESIYEVHNTYLGTLMEVGVPGLLCLVLFQLAILILLAGTVLRNRSAETRVLAFAMGAAFLIVCLYGMGSFGLRQRPFWIIAGLALGTLNAQWLKIAVFTRRRAQPCLA